MHVLCRGLKAVVESLAKVARSNAARAKERSDSAPVPRGWRALGGISLTIAILQSLCTAVFAISGVRVLIGLGALAAVSGIYAPARGFHQDAIRIPMLIFATAGALVNLGVLAWIWHLRAQSSAQWRRQELSKRQKRSERLQVFLAILTLILVGLETWTHPKIHRTGPPPRPVSTLKQVSVVEQAGIFATQLREFYSRA
jgi:ABC-type xylose transport system permease subunit